MKFTGKGKGSNSKFGNKSGPTNRKPRRGSDGPKRNANFEKLGTSFKSKWKNNGATSQDGFKKGGDTGFNKGRPGNKFGKSNYGGRGDRDGAGGSGGRFSRFKKENIEIKDELVEVKEEEGGGGTDQYNFFGAVENDGRSFGGGRRGIKKEEGDDEEDIAAMRCKGGGVGQKKGKNNKNKKAGGFQAMGLSPLVLKGVLRRGYNIPTPIQRKAILPILEGRDVVAMARTGSGKTAAFLIPLFQKLEMKRAAIGTSAKFPRALVLSPTRELALQTVKFMREIGKFMDFKLATILGGESMESQFQTLHDKPDIVVATPGRFMHLCVEMELKLDGVEYVVFDEADRLFEMGFGEQLTEVLRRLPESRQTVLFSATLPKLLVQFSKAGLHDPTLIRLDVDTKLPDQLQLTYLACRSEDKLSALLYLLKNVIDEKQQTIVFTSTKHHVEFLHQANETNISNCYIYSSLDPAARKISLGKFRSGKCNVMIVTDIAARGIDIPILDNVLNFHFPAKPKLFMHRVGRVARAGRSGTAYSILSPDEIAFLIDLHLFLDKPLLFQNPTESDDQEQSESAFVGRIPQDLLNDENNFIRSILEIKLDLATLSKVSKNGYSQYLKSRPNASTESNRRAKGIEVSKLHVHPIFTDHIAEDPMDSLITQMQSYRPNATIFEIGPKAGSETNKIMKLKRVKDQNAVERYRTKAANTNIHAESITEKLKGNKEDDTYISYMPRDHHTELGLSVGTTFDKQVQEAVMDLTGDDSDLLKKQNTMQKWDQKKKRFVSMGKETNGKKIKTESGVWISASYKSDRYEAWMRKSKSEHQADDDDGSDDDMLPRNRSDSSTRKPAFSKKLVKTGKNEAPSTQKGSRKRFKTEIKRPEQILKQRKTQEKKVMKNLPKGMRQKRQKSGGGGGGNKKGGFKKKR